MKVTVAGTDNSMPAPTRPRPLDIRFSQSTDRGLDTKTILLVICTLLLLSSCFKKPEEGAEPGKNRLRVVSLVPSITDTLVYLGKEGDLVGVTRYCQVPPDRNASISVIGDFLNPNIEKIASLDPDLILSSDWKESRANSSIRELGLNLVYVPIPTTLDDIKDNILLVGRLLGDTEAGMLAAKRFESELQSISGLFRNSRFPFRKVFFQVSAPGLWTPGQYSYLTDAMSRIGLPGLFRFEPFNFQEVNAEFILSGDPDLVLYFSPDGTDDNSLSLFRKTSAGKNGAIIAVPRDGGLGKPSPYILRGMRELHTLLKDRISTSSRSRTDSAGKAAVIRPGGTL